MPRGPAVGAAGFLGALAAADPPELAPAEPLQGLHPGGQLAGYAAEVGAFSLRWFTDYFGVPANRVIEIGAQVEI